MAKKKFISTKMKVVMASVLIGSIASFTAAGVVLYNSDYKLSNYFDISELEFDFYRNNNSSYYGNKIFTDNIEINGLENLDFIFDSNSAYFESYNGNSIEISLYSTSQTNLPSNSTPFIANSENNHLKVTPNKEVVSDTNSNKYTYVIKIPTSYNKELKINSSLGRIELNNFNITSLDIKSKNTNVNLNNVSCNNGHINITNGDFSSKAFNSKELSIEGVNSNIYSSQISGNVNITSINGYVHCTASNNLTNLNTSVNSGDIELNIPSDGNFTINPSVINGSFHNDVLDDKNDKSHDQYDENHNKIPTPFTLGNGENKITLSVVNGHISIDN